MNARDRIIVALDVADRDQLDQLASSLKGKAKWIKIGMELYYSQGPSIIESLREDFSIFLDLKIHDIPNTAYKAAKTLAKLGVQMTNCHCAGGVEMMKAFCEGANQGNSNTPILLGVTQLTSTNEEQLAQELLIHKPLKDTIDQYAMNAKKAGLHGVVASAHEVLSIKEKCGDNFQTVTPGIRPASAAQDDQKRVATPHQAIHELKSDYLVIGRPITQSSNPGKSLDDIIKEIES